ncbi:MAG: S41 family peptidase [Syntrophomonadaceae bacterium]|nr:S41 family peptidase [Thermoanaerobacterales bacterium]NLN21712.1 S41 family peptidase [Syntrophomonadaceae bacterium]
MDRLKARVVRVTIAVLIMILLIGIVGGLYYWAEKYNLEKLITTYYLIKNEYLEQVSTETLINGAIKGMVESLNDSYSVYLDKDAFKNLNVQIEGTFGGIGVEIDKDENKQLVVITPLPGTPADRAGLKSGDIIEKVDEQETAKLTAIEAASLIRGEPGTSVTLKILREKENRSFIVKLVREKIAVPSVRGEILPDYQEIGYLQVWHFNRTSTIAQLEKELNKLNKEQLGGLILDLRGNPGGDLEAAVELAGYFLKEGPVVRIVSRDGDEEVRYPSRLTQIQVPLVVLIDEGTASASEIVAGAIKDSSSGLLLGTRTFGKGLVQTLYSLGDNEGLKLTTNRYLTPNGHDINDKGIQPDIVVEQPEDTDEDVQLEKAVEVLYERINQGKQAA